MMAELQPKPEEEKPELSENNVLSPGLVEESLILKPTVSSAEEDFFSEDILQFLDNECSRPNNVTTVFDLTQDKLIDDNVNLLDLTGDAPAGVESYPTRIYDLCQTMEELKESNHSQISSRKHKLHVVSECEGSASKSVKINSPNSTSHFNEPVGFPRHIFTGSHHVAKNHTVTSADVTNATNTREFVSNRDRLETHLEPYSPTTVDLPPYRPRPRELYPTIDPSVKANVGSGIWPTTPQIGLGLDVLSNNSVGIYPQTKNSTQANPMNRPTTDLNDTQRSVYVHDPPLFYQLLEMFPDIEENFLRDICIGKHDLNEVIDIILEKNNYPKVGSSKQTNPEPYTKTQRPLNMPQSLDKNPPLSYPVTSRPIHSYPASSLGNTAAAMIPLNRTNEEVYAVSEQNKLTESEDRPTPIVQNCLSKGDHTETFQIPSNLPLPIIGLNSHCLDVPVAEQNDDMKKLDFLMKIFPDADPAFLQTKCKLGESDLRNVVSEALENNNYPKIVIKEEKKVEDNDQSDLGLYTTSFDVEKFLNIFPEPFQYFFDEKRICRSNQHCLEFMKRR